MFYKTKQVPYFLAVTVWVMCALNAGCKSVPVDSGTIVLEPIANFEGISRQGSDDATQIAAVSLSHDGSVLTLTRDTGRISEFSLDGHERRSWTMWRDPPGRRTFRGEGIAVQVTEDRVFAVDGKASKRLTWTRDGRLLESRRLSQPLSPGDTAIAPGGELLHSTDGFTSDAQIVLFGESGKILRKFGELPPGGAKLPRIPSIRDSLANRQVPPFLQNSALVAPGEGDIVWVLSRTAADLTAYASGRRIHARKLDLPELDAIRQAIVIRNQQLKAPATYIPYSYWSDLCVDERGFVYILVSLQTHHVVYRLDPDGSNPRKLVGAYGKGHLLDVRDGTLVIVDSGKRAVYVYQLPDFRQNAA